jgi:genome maintenance exonuclease 1
LASNDNRFTHLECPDITTIKQVNANGKRHYETPAGPLVSITTVIHHFTPDGIKQWRENMGEDVANYIMRTSSIRGTHVHKLVDSFLSNESLANITREYGVTAVGLFNLMRPALERISNIVAVEKRVYSTDPAIMVAGTTDCVADYEGILSIIDFKTSSKMRAQDTIDSWMIQATFYALAWECLTGQKISQLVIICATEDGQTEVFKSEPSEYVERLKKLIADYRADIGSSNSNDSI